VFFVSEEQCTPPQPRPGRRPPGAGFEQARWLIRQTVQERCATPLDRCRHIRGLVPVHQQQVLDLDDGIHPVQLPAISPGQSIQEQV
jgi:hypothetical protein